jgi:rod shape-determining protein MreC
VIGGLVVLCLIVFTVYFREGPGGPMHGAQRMAGSTVAPLQAVGSRVVQPFVDAWGWVTGLVDARGENARLKDENAALRAQVLSATDQTAEVARLRGLLRVTGALPGGYRPVVASVVGRSPTNWYSRARLDAGTSDGVVVNSPVVAAASPGSALVGVITQASRGSSVVTFITDSSVRVGATVDGSGGALGVLRPTVAGQLMLDGVPREFRVRDGAVVRTAGFAADMRLPSVFPRGIPVGQVAGAGSRDVDTFQTIQVSPFVDVRTLASVAVLAPQSAAARRRAAG